MTFFFVQFFCSLSGLENIVLEIALMTLNNMTDSIEIVTDQFVVISKSGLDTDYKVLQHLL